MHKIKKQLMDELKELEKKGKLSAGDLDVIQKLTSAIKNIDKIEMMEGEDGYSEAGRWGAMGRYDDGNSYARRGEGRRYSRDNMPMYDDDMSYANRRRDSMGRYSRDGGKGDMMEKLEDMMENAENREQREVIKKCMKELERV